MYLCFVKGGLKAVVWTDTIQTVVMFGGAIAVAVLGTMQVGGFDEVWKRNSDSGRIEFFKYTNNNYYLTNYIIEYLMK